MFQTLYTRYRDQLTDRLPDRRHLADRPFPWPAAYTPTPSLAGRNVPAGRSDDRADDRTAPVLTLRVGNSDGNGTLLRLSWEDLLRFPRTTQYRRIVSAQGWTYKTQWEGILLKTLLARLPLSGDARFIRQTNLPGQEEFLPLSALLAQEALLCYKVQDRLLPPLYGGPLWLLVFDRYSYKGLGQLRELALLSDLPPEAGRGFWADKGYDPEGVIVPGRYYAFDLGEYRAVEMPGEITGY